MDNFCKNYKNFNYPRDKLFWIILDDSPDDSLKKQLPDDISIRYIYNNNKEPIGAKRNRLASEVFGVFALTWVLYKLGSVMRLKLT